ncbi:MAG: alanine racemase, partial [Chloroflexota bacterium]
SGIPKGQVKSLLEEVSTLSHVVVGGLMTVPPFREDPEDVRRFFRELAELRAQLGALRLPSVDLKELSMGMTHDYPVAVEEGATIVRIGTALFGPRNQ